MKNLYLKKGDRVHLRDDDGEVHLVKILRNAFYPLPVVNYFVERLDGGLWRPVPHDVLLAETDAAQPAATQLDSQWGSVEIVPLKEETEEEIVKPEEILPVTIEMKPMDEAPEVASPKPIDEQALQDMVTRLTRPMFQTALNTMYDEMDRRGKDLLSQMRKETTGHKMVAAVQVNEGAIAKLTKEAHPQLLTCILYLKAGLHPLLVGPSGCGKTFMAEQVAEALKLPYGHLTFNAGVSETWLYGRQLPGGFVEGTFSKLFREGGVFLADEIDAADSNLLLTLNTALANGTLYNPMSGESLKKHANFHCIGAANTFGKGGDSVYTARNRLDATTLDRFTPLVVDYDAKVEKGICPDDGLCKKLQNMRKRLKERGSKEILSYRAFDKGYRLKAAAGYSDKRVMEILTAAWPDNLAQEVGAFSGA